MNSYSCARYYESSTGRFLSQDAVKFFGGVNFYRYVLNNPIAFFDPSGLKEVPDSFIGPLEEGDYRTSEMEQTKCGRIPPRPPGVSVDSNISEAMAHWNPWWFYDQVRLNAPWDYKQKSRLYEDFGNFNYGATGHAFGFPENALLREAGRASLKADPRRANMGLGDPGSRWNPWGGTPPYGDDWQDQGQIKRGIEYCKCELAQKPYN